MNPTQASQSVHSCLAALENLHNKYAITARDIETKRDAATAKLDGFLVELGYG